MVEGNGQQQAEAHRLASRAGFDAVRFQSLYWNILRFLVAGILLLAAGLKLHHFLTAPPVPAGLLAAPWFVFLQVELEVFLALWLLSGVYARLARSATLGLFVVFVAVTLWQATSGKASCGCFGNFEVSPWYSLLLDGLIVAAFVLVRAVPKVDGLSCHRLRVAAVPIGCGLLGVGFIVAHQLRPIHLRTTRRRRRG